MVDKREFATLDVQFLGERPDDFMISLDVCSVGLLVVFSVDRGVDRDDDEAMDDEDEDDESDDEDADGWIDLLRLLFLVLLKLVRFNLLLLLLLLLPSLMFRSLESMYAKLLINCSDTPLVVLDAEDDVILADERFLVN